MWISNAPNADIAVVWAKDDDNAIRGFIVERGMKGFSTPKIEGKFSLRTSPTGEISLQDCFVPEANMLPKAKGLSGPFGCLNKARFGIVWGAMGAAEFCWHAARRYVLERTQFGNAARRQSARPEEARRHADRDRARPLRRAQLGRMMDEGRRATETISLLEAQQLRQGARHRARRSRHARRQRHLGRIWRHPSRAEIWNRSNTYEGTHDIHALVLGRAQTGIQAFM
jgi:glutaryl-CoA dehydrogenase